MTPLLARRRLLGALLGFAAGPGALAQEGRDEGLAALAALLEAQLARRKGALPLPWRESIVDPDRSRLVWYQRSFGSAAAPGDTFRVAFDPATRWYFVVRVSKGSARTKTFGPLERQPKGGFVEAFGRPAR